ncbi:MAG: response regulator [Defluviitaleaceae bacterium]|nr:response regulator [Defluviitaleaceae bacterium]
MKILIVEDTAILRTILKDILKKFCKIDPEKIFEAADAMKALADYKTISPDMVFMDIGMPKLNGKEAVRQLLEIDPNAYIVMCTGSRKMNDVVECVRAGAKDYLVKPLDPERVKEALRKMEENDNTPPPIDDDDMYSFDDSIGSYHFEKN